MNKPPRVDIAHWDFYVNEGETIDKGVILRTNRTQIYIPHARLIEFADFMVDTYETNERSTP